ncbi:MAG: phage tail protein [Luteolibacter sp.]
MSDPLIGQVKMAGFNFAPRGYFPCDGSLRSISEYTALFSLIGTTYGGDGQNTFALPDLRGRMPIHQGTGPGLSSYVMGQAAGTQTVTVLPTQLPVHTHALTQTVSNPCQGGAGNTKNPTGNYYAADSGTEAFSTTQNATMSTISPSSTVSPAGGSVPHENMPPYLCVNFVIAAEGIFPSRN